MSINVQSTHKYKSSLRGCNPVTQSMLLHTTFWDIHWKQGFLLRSNWNKHLLYYLKRENFYSAYADVKNDNSKFKSNEHDLSLSFNHCRRSVESWKKIVTEADSFHLPQERVRISTGNVRNIMLIIHYFYRYTHTHTHTKQIVETHKYKKTRKFNVYNL